MRTQLFIKKIFTLLLTGIFFISNMSYVSKPIIETTAAEQPIISGSYGTVSWNFYDAGSDNYKVVFSGTGTLSQSIHFTNNFPASKIQSIVIEDGIIEIDNCAFGVVCFENLESVDIADSVTTIGEGCFSECPNLKEVKLPQNNKFKEIADGTFRGCSSLETIDIPDSIIRIGYCAFSGCSSLSGIEFPKNLVKLDNAFQGCTKLTEINLPNTLTTFGGLNDVPNIKKITIPAKCATITGYFDGCTSLEEVNVEAGNANYFSIDGVMYKGKETAIKGNTIVCYPPEKKSTAFIIPKGTNLTYGVEFGSNEYIETIVYPEDTGSGCYILGDFRELSNLISIYIPEQYTSISILPPPVLGYIYMARAVHMQKHGLVKMDVSLLTVILI